MSIFRKLFGSSSPPKPNPTPSAAPPKPAYDYILEESRFENGRGLVVVRATDGQRLAWQSLPRRDGLESINVVGEQHYLAALQNKAFAYGNAILLKPEPDNPYDPNAIAVYDADGKHKVGYIPKEDAPRLLNKMKRGRFACIAMWETWEGKKRIQLRLLLIDEKTMPRVQDMSTTP